MLALDKHTTGDGIVSALLVLQAVSRSGRTLDELLESVVLFPQTLINVRLAPDADWQANARFAKVRAEVARELEGQGRVLVRPSGTEPLVRVMVEATTEALSRSSAERIAETLR